MTKQGNLEAIILTAGYSSRAKDFKMNLMIGDKTVLEHTLSKFEGICDKIVIVTGYKRLLIEKTIAEIKQKNRYSFETVITWNENYDKGMFSSIQTGCKMITSQRFFLTPGDCPLVNKETVNQLANNKGDAVIPSYQYKGGHPILLSKKIKLAILSKEPSYNLRDLLKEYAKIYINVEDENVLVDLDTRDDYKNITENYKRSLSK